MQTEPWIERDRAMIDPLRTLGIEKGKPFKPDAETRATLDAAAVEAKAFLDDGYERGWGAFFEGTDWRSVGAAGPRQRGRRPATRCLTPTRRICAAWPTAYAFVGIKRLGTGQFYLMALHDTDGASLDGARAATA